jgi:hypothetical protein
MSLHKPRATYENMLFHMSYGFNYYLQLLRFQFLSKTHLYLKKNNFCHQNSTFSKIFIISVYDC